MFVIFRHHPSLEIWFTIFHRASLLPVNLEFSLGLCVVMFSHVNNVKADSSLFVIGLALGSNGLDSYSHVRASPATE